MDIDIGEAAQMIAGNSDPDQVDRLAGFAL